MEIKINVYQDCTTTEPTKTYTVRRILFKTAKELAVLKDASASETDEKQEAITLKMLQAVITDFTEDDLQGVDPIELGDFLRNIGDAIGGVIKNAEKN